MTTITETVFPVLYKKTSTGAIQMWQIKVEDSTIVTVYGQKDGKQQEARDVIKEGKNIGRSNETTPEQQAVTEAQSQWDKKVKRGYVKDLSDAEAGRVDTTVITGGINPMLAKNYSEHSSKIVFPAAVQPKLDGHRCIAVIENGKATLWSRTRKPITGVPHIIEKLESLKLPGIILDGELYHHDYRDKFEELTSFIKRPDPKPGHDVVQYHIYDTVINAMTFEQRWDTLLRNGFDKSDKHLVLVETHEVFDEQELMDMFALHRERGYEGSIVRNLLSPYVQKRSVDLQKIKEFNDAEFEVVGIEEGRGKMAGKAVFICKVPNSEEVFKCKMVGSLDSLSEYLKEPSKWIGKQLTVQFQNYSANGVPRFGVGLRFREDI